MHFTHPCLATSYFYRLCHSFSDAASAQDLISTLESLPSLNCLHVNDESILPDQSPIMQKLIRILCCSVETPVYTTRLGWTFTEIPLTTRYMYSAIPFPIGTDSSSATFL
ncbi:hypothetical protein BT96DRAFT_918325 [Gymnopus androsaceus JB14]|uniref:Uncharacterized protein n=1 Tax=Gymnopus androsaceus JB14 TaxID=1447944 RepID=A0A6A4I0L1_9AGAR|nr:hypothetical protein BT96DRAFT_918325 [Gymnopus androsaceus JB14]